MANLMDTATAPESLIVNVKDHDVNVPDDLGGGTSSIWKQKDVRVWLYVLGAAVLILVIVFAMLSRQTSLFQGATRVTVTNTDSNVSEGDLEDFNGSAATDGFSGLGEDIVGEGDYAAAPGEGGSVDINDLLDGVIDSGDLEGDDLDNLDSLFDDLDSGDDDPVDEDGFAFEPIVDDPFAPSQFFPAPGPTNSEIATNQGSGFSGMDLNSNTDSEVLDSPIVQGDTGPSVAIAFVPSIFYALARRRKDEI